METWWQSPPLSRGMKYNEVNLTIDLGQVKFYTLSPQIILHKIKVHECTCDLRKVADPQIWFIQFEAIVVWSFASSFMAVDVIILLCRLDWVPLQFVVCKTAFLRLIYDMAVLLLEQGIVVFHSKRCGAFRNYVIGVWLLSTFY